MQMQDFFKDARYKRAYSTISFAFFVFLVEISIYEMLRKFEIKQYWLLLPLGMYILGATFAKHIKIVRIVMAFSHCAFQKKFPLIVRKT